MKTNKFGQLKGCSKWVLAAVAAAASVHFADNPTYRGVNWNDALLVGSAPRGGLSIRQLRNLPTWSLKAVAEAAAKRSGRGMESVRCRNILTEFERRRAKRLAKEAEETANA